MTVIEYLQHERDTVLAAAQKENRKWWRSKERRIERLIPLMARLDLLNENLQKLADHKRRQQALLEYVNSRASAE